MSYLLADTITAPGEIKYFSLTSAGGSPVSWQPDMKKAIQFARRIDVEQFAKMYHPTMQTSAVEFRE